ncbi:hypothetical protein KSS87_007521 [Heliosperma pusillum]|nr:hypothetical protein KSS87_007521 [Heliosperma pusillum]
MITEPRSQLVNYGVVTWISWHWASEFHGDAADDSSSDSMILFPKRTFQPSTLRRKRVHGFFAREVNNVVVVVPVVVGWCWDWWKCRMTVGGDRKATKGGRRVIARRVAKGRHRVTA